MQKIIVELELPDNRCKQKAMKSVSGLPGVCSVSMDTNGKKITVIGDVDAVDVVRKLRRHCHARIDFVGPAKVPENKKEEPEYNDQIVDFAYAYAYGDYNPHMTTRYCVEENPNACVIC